MRLVAASILVLAVVIAVVGWRATEHHNHCVNSGSLYVPKCK